MQVFSVGISRDQLRGMNVVGIRIAAALALTGLLVLPPAASASGDRVPPIGTAFAGPERQARAMAEITAHAARNGIRLDRGPGTVSAADSTGVSPVVALFLHYARLVGFGQVQPGAAQIPWDIKRSVFDPEAALAALRGKPLAGALRSLPPPHREYRRLVRALARYREIVSKGGWSTIPRGATLRLGSNGERVALLRRRLAAEGYLLPAAGRGGIFDELLARAVIRYQRRNGLEPDGAVGPKTLAALNLSAAYRVEQIAANMERWRWMPRVLPVPRVSVNIASQELAIIGRRGKTLVMRTVVGSPRHPTPPLQSEIRSVIVNPPWNVPLSIWRNELLPRLRREPGYLAANDMVIIGRERDPHGLKIDWADWTRPPGGIRIRQMPGPKNALGRVKFDIPNRFDVYLHDTPHRDVFRRPERALSHGCIRLQNPAGLYAYLLGSQGAAPPLPPEHHAGPYPTKTIPVAKPVPVFLLYWTAFAGPDGAMQFRKDIYGHDARIAALISGAGAFAGRVASAGGCPFHPSRG